MWFMKNWKQAVLLLFTNTKTSQQQKTTPSMNIIVEKRKEGLVIRTPGLSRDGDFKYTSTQFEQTLTTSGNPDEEKIMCMCVGIERVIKSYE